MKYIYKDKINRRKFRKNEVWFCVFRWLLTNQKLSLLFRSQISLLQQQMFLGGYSSLIQNRCVLTGSGRSVSRRFRISRICLRNLSLSGLVPGLKKASW